jgi:hypothetical protein
MSWLMSGICPNRLALRVVEPKWMTLLGVAAAGRRRLRPAMCCAAAGLGRSLLRVGWLLGHQRVRGPTSG